MRRQWRWSTPALAWRAAVVSCLLLDGGLPESAPLIAANIRALGFRVEDVKLIVNSHAHFDHAGGIAALQRSSGATVAAHPWSARFMELGKSIEGDPQFGLDIPYPPVSRVRRLEDGDTLRVGPLAVVAHYTGGHTPGSTSWSWRSCDDSGRCVNVVYGDSQTAVSADSFLYSRNSTYPNAVDDFRGGIARLEQLPCDLLLTPHPGASGMLQKLARRERGDADAFLDANSCKTYAATARQRLEQRLERERTGR